jgi:hypothetical protein
MQTLYEVRGDMRGRVGTVVPAWYPSDMPAEEAAQLLATTLADSPSCAEPQDVVVVVDGSPVALAAARKAQEDLGKEWSAPFRLIELPENRGKGAALVAGIRWLLEREATIGPVAWIAARDADGDHLIDDLPHLYRTGEQLAEECPRRPSCVIGRRANLHAPLGWMRGEYERLVNEVIVEAVAFSRARSGEVWDTRYLVERAPDLQSGYKLYSRSAAALAARSLEEAAAAYPGLHLQRTGMEIVPFVSLALAGAVFAEVERKSYHDQPVTSYGSVDMPVFYGSKLAWAVGACGVPVDAAVLLIDGALARRHLWLDPAGRSGLLELRRFVLETLGADPFPDTPLTRRFL